MSESNELTPEQRAELLSRVEYLGEDGSEVIEVPMPQRVEPCYASKTSKFQLDPWAWVREHWPDSTPEQQGLVLLHFQDRRTREVTDKNQPKLLTDTLVYQLFQKITEARTWSTRQIGAFVGRSHKSVSKTSSYKVQCGINEQVKREKANDLRRKNKPPLASDSGEG